MIKRLVFILFICPVIIASFSYWLLSGKSFINSFISWGLDE